MTSAEVPSFIAAVIAPEPWAWHNRQYVAEHQMWISAATRCSGQRVPARLLTVAERLEGQDGEGLLDLDSNLLDAKEEEGDHHRAGDGGPMIPRLASHLQRST